MSFLLRVHRGEAQLRELSPEWERLRRAPEADLDLFLVTCRHRPQVISPWALSAWRGDHCEVLIFGRLERSRLSPSLGYARLPALPVVRLSVPYEGVLGGIEPELAGPLMERLETLLRDWVADFCSFSALREDNGLWPALACRAGQSLGASRPEWTRRWVLELDREPDFLLRRMRAKHRTWHKRKERELAQAHPDAVHWHWLNVFEQTEEVVRQLERVARQTYQRGLGVGFRDDPETRETLALLARRGWLRVMLLEVAGRPGGFWVGAVLGDTFFARATGYAPALGAYEVGTGLVLRLTAALVREGVTRLDWGPGDVEYKQRFGTLAWREARVELFGRSRRSRWLRGYKAAGDWLGRCARLTAARLGVLQTVKQAWRRRLARYGAEPTASLR